MQLTNGAESFRNKHTFDAHSARYVQTQAKVQQPQCAHNNTPAFLERCWMSLLGDRTGTNTDAAQHQSALMLLAASSLSHKQTNNSGTTGGSSL